MTASQTGGPAGPGSGRLKLVTVSACWSAALTVADQRRLLGLPVPDESATPNGPAVPVTPKSAPGSLATELARRLGCTVLAMRYPVGDEFAIALGRKLYELLAGGRAAASAGARDGSASS